jgi:hypothetical protein
MPRPGERRPMVAFKADQADVDDLDALASASGVGRSDVLRAGVEVLLRGLQRDRLLDYLIEAGKESCSGSLTPDLWQRITARAGS